MEYVTKTQIAFGQRLGLDLAGKSVGEAQAMIEDAIQRDFILDHDLGAPTPARSRGRGSAIGVGLEAPPPGRNGAG